MAKSIKVTVKGANGINSAERIAAKAEYAAAKNAKTATTAGAFTAPPTRKGQTPSQHTETARESAAAMAAEREARNAAQYWGGRSSSLRINAVNEAVQTAGETGRSTAEIQLYVDQYVIKRMGGLYRDDNVRHVGNIAGHLYHLLHVKGVIDADYKRATGRYRPIMIGSGKSARIITDDEAAQQRADAHRAEMKRIADEEAKAKAKAKKVKK